MHGVFCAVITRRDSRLFCETLNDILYPSSTTESTSLDVCDTHVLHGLLYVLYVAIAYYNSHHHRHRDVIVYSSFPFHGSMTYNLTRVDPATAT